MSCELQTAKMETHTLLISTRDKDTSGNVRHLQRTTLDKTRLVYSFHHSTLFILQRKTCVIALLWEIQHEFSEVRNSINCSLVLPYPGLTNARFLDLSSSIFDIAKDVKAWVTSNILLSILHKCISTSNKMLLDNFS